MPRDLKKTKSIFPLQYNRSDVLLNPTLITLIIGIFTVQSYFNHTEWFSEHFYYYTRMRIYQQYTYRLILI